MPAALTMSAHFFDLGADECLTAIASPDGAPDKRSRFAG